MKRFHGNKVQQVKLGGLFQTLLQTLLQLHSYREFRHQAFSPSMQPFAFPLYTCPCLQPHAVCIVHVGGLAEAILPARRSDPSRMWLVTVPGGPAVERRDSSSPLAHCRTFHMRHCVHAIRIGSRWPWLQHSCDAAVGLQGRHRHACSTSSCCCAAVFSPCLRPESIRLWPHVPREDGHCGGLTGLRPLPHHAA